MDLKTYNLIFYYSMGAILIPIILLLIRYNRQPVVYKWLAVLLLFSFLCDFLNEVQYNTIHLPVNYLGTVYYVINPILISVFFYYALAWRSAKIYFIIFNIACLAFSLANFLLIQKTTINTYSAIIEKLQIMILCILYFYKVVKELPAERIYQIGLFWIVSSLFIINSCKLVLYSFAHYLVIFKDNLMVLWSLHNTLSIILSLAIAAGIAVHYKNQSSSQTQHSRS
jgi:hypothetical protein